MDRWQFSIGGLLIGFVAVSAALAAMTIPSPWIISAVYTLQVLLLATAICGTIAGGPRSRAFWIGWLAFGALYVNATGTSAFFAPQGANATGRPRMLTEPLIDFLSQWGAPPLLGSTVQAQWTNGSYYAGKITQISGGQYEITWSDGSAPIWVTLAQIKSDPTTSQVQGHCVCALLVSWGGAVFSLRMFGPRPAAETIAAAERVAAPAPVATPAPVAASAREAVGDEKPAGETSPVAASNAAPEGAIA